MSNSISTVDFFKKAERVSSEAKEDARDQMSEDGSLDSKAYLEAYGRSTRAHQAMQLMSSLNTVPLTKVLQEK